MLKRNQDSYEQSYSGGVHIYAPKQDFLGRRTSKNDEQYGYNVRDELISADDVSYNYDDIGIYAPTSASEVGNQTLIKTSTGIWSVQYNVENRTIRWQSGNTVITMSFDRMGRRVEMCTLKDGSDRLQRFVYDNYLCIQQLRGVENALFHSYVWDPTEPIATRPLILIPTVGEIAYYFHDGNKNVSDLIPNPEPPIHYSYTPFGTPTASAPSENPYTFSSEVYDNTLGLIYYNYRHCAFCEGRWIGRDILQYPIEKRTFLTTSPSPYSLLSNVPTYQVDILGAAYIAKRPLDIPAGGGVMNIPMAIGGIGGGAALNGLLGAMNLGLWHEQIVYQDGKQPTNEGFFDDGDVKEDPLSDELCCCEFWVIYDDEVVRNAVENVKKRLKPYDLLRNNCQDFVEIVKDEYQKLRQQQSETEQNKQGQPDFRWGTPTMQHITPLVD